MKTKPKPIHKIRKIVEIVPDKYPDFLFPDTALKLSKSVKKVVHKHKLGKD